MRDENNLINKAMCPTAYMVVTSLSITGWKGKKADLLRWPNFDVTLRQ